MSEARVRVSVTDGTIEVEGTEAFVDAQLEKHYARIRTGAARGEAGDPPALAIDEAVARTFESTAAGIRILSEIPGRSVAEKMVNAAKLLAFAALTLTNRRSVLVPEVRAVCKAHRCYDQHNLVTVLRKHPTVFVIGGKGRSQTVSLTEEGVREVQRWLPTLGAPAPLG